MDVSLERVTKNYGRKKALDDLSLNFAGGKIHALLGDNGAGKSTAAKILSGETSADSGRISIDGKEARFHGTRDAIRAGIICVRQRPRLALGLSAMQNISLGAEVALPRASKKFLEERAKALRDEWRPSLDIGRKAKDLGSDDRFYTALISALLRRPRFLILDEPSALLGADERASLFRGIKNFSQEGNTVLLITHIMEDARVQADSVIFLREGKVAPETGVEQKTCVEQKTAAAPKIGVKIFSAYEGAKTCAPAENENSRAPENFPSITFRDVSAFPPNRAPLRGVSFHARAGQITLIQGTSEDGMETLENVVTGMEKSKGVKGTCEIFTGGGENVSIKCEALSPAFLRFKSHLRAAIVPTDRTFRASNPNLTVAQILCSTREGKVDEGFARDLISKAQVNAKADDFFSTLSGGMAQRLILARELSSDPLLAIACNPLQGLDAETSEKIFRLFESLARDGKIVLVLSTSGFPAGSRAKLYRLEKGKLREEAGE